MSFIISWWAGNAQGVHLEMINMDLQVSEFLKAIKFSSDSPRKMMVSSEARFLNPSSVQQFSEYLDNL